MRSILTNQCIAYYYKVSKVFKFFQGLLQVEIILKLFWRNRLAGFGPEESYSKAVLLTRNIICHNKNYHIKSGNLLPCFLVAEHEFFDRTH